MTMREDDSHIECSFPPPTPEQVEEYNAWVSKAPEWVVITTFIPIGIV